MNTDRKRSMSRRDFLRLGATFAGVATMNACAQDNVPLVANPSETPRIIDTETPTAVPTNTPVIRDELTPIKEAPFDFCNIEEGMAVDPSIQYKEATPEPTEVLFPDDTEAVKKWTVSEENFVGYQDGKYKYQTV